MYKYDGFTRTLRVDPQRCGRVPPSRDRETVGKGACREGEAVLVGVGHLRKKGSREGADTPEKWIFIFITEGGTSVKGDVVR